MSDLIRREDAARIAEDHNLDIWEYSTGNRSRIGHDPVAEAIRALPAVQPDAAAAIEALTAERDGLLRCVTDNHVALCRAEKAEAERDRLREDLEELDFLRHEGGPDSVAAIEAERDRLRELVREADDLICGDLTGLQWKRSCREFLVKARAELKGETP